MPELDWICSSFAELDRDLLYGILRLRAEVFVVEQDCAYQDLDNFDQQALHLCGFYGSELVCYARINPPGAKTPYAAISRVLVAAGHRSGGLGRRLMSEAIEHCEKLWPGEEISLAAQQHLQEFYASMDFRPISRSYMDEGIRHIDMVR